MLRTGSFSRGLSHSRQANFIENVLRLSLILGLGPSEQIVGRNKIWKHQAFLRNDSCFFFLILYLQKAPNGTKWMQIFKTFTRKHFMAYISILTWCLCDSHQVWKRNPLIFDLWNKEVLIQKLIYIHISPLSNPGTWQAIHRNINILQLYFMKRKLINLD